MKSIFIVSVVSLATIKTYYKNCDSAAATYRDLRADYGLYNRPITQAIAKIV